MISRVAVVVLIGMTLGCASSRHQTSRSGWFRSNERAESQVKAQRTAPAADSPDAYKSTRSPVAPASAQVEQAPDGDSAPPVELIPTLPAFDASTKEALEMDAAAANAVATDAVRATTSGSSARKVQLIDVVDSVYRSYPLVRAAYEQRRIAAGENVSAQGEFDFKLKGDSANTPLGFYKTYRNSVGFEQPLFGGGTAFGGYRMGDGNFEPWYGERETNEGGEFKAGFAVPLWQNRRIDERRAQLFRTAFGVRIVEPEIQIQLIQFLRESGYAYWDWVAAGRQYRYAEQLLDLAKRRNEQIREQANQGDRAQADVTDNRRLINSRDVKRLEALRKFQTSAVKLSLFFRTLDGRPFVPTELELPDDFPSAEPVARDALDSDIGVAQARRPELRSLDLQRQQLDVDMAAAQNQTLPNLDATLINGKDIGARASSKGDKTPNELEASLSFSVPLQRRKGRGKMNAVEGKMIQLAAKRQMTAEKIEAEVAQAVVSLDLAFQQIQEAEEAVELNLQMEEIERIRLENGDSDLLRLNLREQATFDAELVVVEALAAYFKAQVDYRAALALDLPDILQLDGVQ